MIKSKLRLFGWAVGLSLALGAVGAVAAQGAPVETKAAGEKQYELAYSFDCASASSAGSSSKYGPKTTTMTAAYARQFLNDAAGSSIVSSVDAAPTQTYWAKGDGGPVSDNDVLKIGKASGAGDLQFTLTNACIEVTKVVVKAYGWKSTSTLSVNGSGSTTLTSNTTLTEYPFVLASKSRSITLAVTASAILANKIDLYGWKQTLSADIASPYSDETVTLSSDAEGTITWSKVNDGTTAAGAAVTSGGAVSVTGAGNVKVKASAPGYVDKTITISFAEKPAGTTYDVTFDPDGGSVTPSKKVIAENGTFTFPSPGTLAHYSFLGWSSDDGKTLHDVGDTSPAVVADIEYKAYWEEDEKVTVTYVAGTNGTGSNSFHEYLGDEYAILSLADAGLEADSGYRLKNYSVVIGEDAAVSKQPGNPISLTADVTITAIFEETPLSFNLVYPSGTSVNADGSNQANLFQDGQGNQIDNTKWSVVGTNGDANAMQFHSAGEIRLYSNRADGKTGNTLTVTSLDSAVIIKSITLDIQTSYSSTAREVKKIVGGTSTTVSSEDTTYAINGEGFSLYNAHKGGSNNLQIRLDGITIEWDYVSTFKKAQDFESQYVKKGVSYSDGSQGTNCKTWYGQAIEAYNNNTIMGSEARVWFASRSEFANARTRLIAWALENKVHLSFNSQTGDLIYSAGVISALRSGSDSARTPLLVAAFAGIGALAVGGMVFLRKRKEF